MIAVIADDLTGAAEIAGIALGFGLRVQLFMGEAAQVSDTDVMIVSTDSRSMKLPDALQATRQALEHIIRLHPEVIFKKTDSILRGHVGPELAMQSRMTGLLRILLLPGNPSLGRTIRDGIYFVNDTPLAETAFAQDPEFPAQSSDVISRVEGMDMKSGTHISGIPEQGAIIGDIRNEADLDQWAGLVTEDVIPAGGGDFFAAMLRSKYKAVSVLSPEPLYPFIFIQGTSFGGASHPVRRSAIASGRALLIDSAMDVESDDYRQWLYEGVRLKRAGKYLFIGFDLEQMGADADPVHMRNLMGKCVAALCSFEMPAEIFVEGGSSAQAILAAIGIRGCRPTEVWSRGVVRLTSDRVCVTVKPGSYPLPNAVIGLFISPET